MSESFDQSIACKECGANLKFKPGTTSLVCDYCGTENAIAEASAEPTEIKENNLEYALAHFEEESTMEIQVAKCSSCGAESTVDPNISSDSCPFCDTPLAVGENASKKTHKPEYLLPFGIDEKKAVGNFNTWIDKLWWAPSKLKTYASAEKVDGMYIPFWTYDCDTATYYEGERGDDYEESYTDSDGESQTRTKTSWSHITGRIRKAFDDILVTATKSLNKKKLNALQPWDLDQLVAYDDRYLSGFRTETYQISLKEGFEIAKEKMKKQIENDIRRDIGGDKQRIHRTDTQYFNPTFKHILLPVWISAYRYNDKVYQFMVNARTGEVKGERPYSTAKIATAIIIGLAVIGGLIYFFSSK